IETPDPSGLAAYINAVFAPEVATWTHAIDAGTTSVEHVIATRTTGTSTAVDVAELSPEEVEEVDELDPEFDIATRPRPAISAIPDPPATPALARPIAAPQLAQVLPAAPERELRIAWERVALAIVLAVAIGVAVALLV